MNIKRHKQEMLQLSSDPELPGDLGEMPTSARAPFLHLSAHFGAAISFETSYSLLNVPHVSVKSIIS
jgi:hypothetical protein